MNFTGFIAKISTKSGPGRRGPWTLYSAKVEKADGSEYEDWLSFGFTAPTVKEGDYVSIEAEKDAKGYFRVSRVTALKNPPAKPSPAPIQGSTGGSVSNVRQDSIVYQSSRKDAIAVLEILLASAALPLTADKAKAGQAKRYEEIMALVDKLTVRYFNDVNTLRILDVVADEGVQDDDAGSLPEDADDSAEEIDE